MNRDLKFRVWDIKRKKFFTVANIAFFKTGKLITTDTQFGPFLAYELSDTRCELNQYTGVNDKNGREVYEGDVVNIIESSLYHSRSEVTFTGSVQFDKCNAAFMVYSKDGKMYSLTGQEVSCEIIGNVYETI